MQTLTIGDMELDLLLRGDDFHGIGAIRASGVPLRAADQPLTFHLDTPRGVIYVRYELTGIDEVGGGYDLRLKAHGHVSERGEYGDDYGQRVLWLGDLTPPVDDLALELRPAALSLDAAAFTGFTYRLCFASECRQIHRVLFRGTWEIDGSITGNTILQQGQCNKPVYTGSRDELFTTACLRTLHDYGKTDANSFQFGPRAGLLQGFDFQYEPGSGMLLQYWPDFESISSLLESPVGSDRLFTYDEHRFELSHRAATTPKAVLFCAGPVADHSARDAWWDAIRHIYGGIRAQFGVEESHCIAEEHYQVPAVLGGILHRHSSNHSQWVTEEVEVETNKDELHMWIGGRAYHHSRTYAAYADHIFPVYAEMGVRRTTGPVPGNSNDVTELGMRRKLDQGYHGDLHCASVCATHRFYPSDFWGGIDGWRHMYEKGRELGIEVGTWFAPHFSPRSPYMVEHPEWQMIDDRGLPSGGGYGFRTLVVADWNSGIYEQTLEDFARWKERAGLDHIFVDSYSNMGMLQMNHNERMRTNFAAFSRLLRDLQGLGIRSFSFESVTALGYGRFGLVDIRGDQVGQDHAVAGQNDLGWWVGHEDMAYNCMLCSVPRDRDSREREQMLFRAIANRGYHYYHDALDPDTYRLPDGIAALHHAWARAEAWQTGTRRLLPNDAGVRWISAAGQLIFTYLDIDRPAGQIEVIHGEAAGDYLPAWGIYHVSN